MAPTAAEEIARIPLFAALRPESLAAVARTATRKKCPSRERIVDEGDPGESLFLITSGYFKASALSASGKEALLSIMGPGEVFGELSVLDSEPRSATVTALQPGTLLVIHKAPLLELIGSSPELAAQLLKALCARVRSLTQRCEEMGSLPVPGRLAQAILRIADRHGRPHGKVVKIPVRISQQDLGSLAGATRESINKQLGIWQSAGILYFDEGHLVVCAPEELRTMTVSE